MKTSWIIYSASFVSENRAVTSSTSTLLIFTNINAIGKNFNQSVKKLHTLEQIIEFESRVITNETNKKMLLEKVNEIKLKVNQISDKWLQ